MPLERYTAAACQTAHSLPLTRNEIPSRVDRLLEMIDAATLGYGPFFPVKLVVFPEFAISGPSHERLEALHDLVAEPMPNEQTDRLARRAKERGIWIQCGSQLEKDERWPDLVFNTTLLIGPDGYLSKYRKVNPWIPFEVHASPADLLPDYDEPLFPVAETEIGRLGVATCYDWLFPEVTRELACQGAEVLIRISAYMDPWGGTPPMDWWTVINRCRAIENMAAVVAANQGASFRDYPPFSWPGSSQVIDSDGRLLATADPGPGEKIVVAPIDLAGLRDARKTRQGHHFLAHRRRLAYPHQVESGLFPDAAETRPTFASNVRRIEAAKSTLLRNE